MEERAMQQTIWTENDGRDDPENASDDWEFELELVETSDPDIGATNGCSADHPSIARCGVLESSSIERLHRSSAASSLSERDRMVFTRVLMDYGDWISTMSCHINGEACCSISKSRFPNMVLFKETRLERSRNSSDGSFGRKQNGRTLAKSGILCELKHSHEGMRESLFCV